MLNKKLFNLKDYERLKEMVQDGRKVLNLFTPANVDCMDIDVKESSEVAFVIWTPLSKFLEPLAKYDYYKCEVQSLFELVDSGYLGIFCNPCEFSNSFAEILNKIKNVEFAWRCLFDSIVQTEGVVASMDRIDNRFIKFSHDVAMVDTLLLEVNELAKNSGIDGGFTGHFSTLNCNNGLLLEIAGSPKFKRLLSSLVSCTECEKFPSVLHLGGFNVKIIDTSCVVSCLKRLYPTLDTDRTFIILSRLSDLKERNVRFSFLVDLPCKAIKVLNEIGF